MAELLLDGRYTCLNLSAFHLERLSEGLRLDDVQPSEQREHAAGICGSEAKLACPTC
ncbi:hypothetical protein HNQ08_002662 [Deinococcus humi]|uniref:Uncharacterized protein n=1 Tax=Deinococcus humi TaxID=662880 RepID=A0A7W8NEQ0_9DEIO|nr:hypothetical protein [Deinococcus humi]